MAAAGPEEQRVSDAERERVATALRDHAAEGRLTFDELAERVDKAYRARTRGELEPLLGDLEVPESLPAVPARKATHWVVALLGGATKRARWRVGERLTAIAVMGGCELDLRGAELETPEVRLTAIAIMGGIEVIVPEGTDVELGGLALMGANDVRVEGEPRRGGPVLRVRAFSLMGGVDIRSRRGEREPGPPSLPPLPPLPPLPR